MPRPIVHDFDATGGLLFGLETPADYVGKLHYEFGRFCHAGTPAERTYAAFDFAATAWHMLEWSYVYLKQTDHPTFQTFRNDEAFLTWAKGECPALEVMRDVTNASKHRVLSYTPKVIEARASVIDSGDPAASVPFDLYAGTSTVRNSAMEAVRHKIETADNVATFLELAKSVLQFYEARAEMLAIR